MRALIVCAMLSGCGIFARQPPPPPSVVCPAVAMALCDTKTPPVPAEMTADEAADRATFAIFQRNECAELNAAKLACLNQSRKKPK